MEYKKDNRWVNDMEFYICELETKDKDKFYIALEDNIKGISNEYIKKNLNSNFLGYAKYNNYLYPVVTIPLDMEFYLNYFLIYDTYAFGVTSVLNKIKIENFEKFNDKMFELYPELNIYTGYITYEDSTIFIFNMENIKKKMPNRIIVKEKKEKKKIKQEKTIYFLIDNKFVIRNEDVITIINKNNFCYFRFDDYIGFIEYKNQVYPVKEIDDKGNWILLIKDKGYLFKRINQIYGKVIEDTEKQFFKSNNLILPILE
ncbi:hypothetical protein X275_03135 [Marinitoga sp. 1197]|uniref:hypothetical protein n=1 Tax=Marinitoga sp. 1197 TaxID=1428449 RepID=UPI0006415A2E|nr:hypothetical protein [Marinitoga sp. 1197]KLO23350.1 hypothetical protein X275_03135 [Marinitoga sp. 1197]